MACLVVGATGFVGGHVVRGLRERGTPVRALVRGGVSHPRSGELRAAGVDVVDGDVTRPDSLAPACRGIDVVVSVIFTIPGPTGGLLSHPSASTATNGVTISSLRMAT